MDNSVENRIKRNYILLIRTLLITCLGVLPVFITTFAQDDDLTEIFHVYVDDKHIGKVDDKNIVQQVINDKILENLNKSDDIRIVLGQSVSMVPEKMFKFENNNEDVKEYLEKNLTVNALATEIKIDNQTVGYFANEDEATEVLTEYKLKYVNEEEITKIENMNETTTENQVKQEELSVGDSVISDIKFSKDVSISEKSTLPEEILNIEQGVKLLEKGTLEEKIHKVDKGEVLGEIAKKYDLSTKELLELNSSLTEETILQIGQEINVTEHKPFVNVLVFEDELVEEEVNYNTEIIESEDMYKGDEKVKQKGKNGKKKVHYRIENSNGNVVEKVIVDEEVIEEPTDKIIVEGTKVIPSRGTGDLIWPADGGYVSSQMGERWGSMHKGIDIARPTTRAIFAADHGVVESVALNDGGYGNKVVINHNNGMRTLYAHLSSIDVKSGQTVEKGTEIGIMGTTGNSTGIHLHFEVHLDGALKNPLDYY